MVVHIPKSVMMQPLRVIPNTSTILCISMPSIATRTTRDLRAPARWASKANSVDPFVRNWIRNSRILILIFITSILLATINQYQLIPRTKEFNTINLNSYIVSKTVI